MAATVVATHERADAAERILRAAIALFRERGYHGSSMRTLARALRMEAASLYYHFASKQMKVVGKNLLVARPAILYIKDIPIMWLPFVFQDMRSGRRSGLIPPRFTTPEGTKLSAAWLVEQSGFHKGYTRGAVGISSKHTLAIVNRGGAGAADVVAFARQVRQRVQDRFGVTLVPEPVFVNLSMD